MRVMKAVADNTIIPKAKPPAKKPGVPPKQRTIRPRPPLRIESSGTERAENTTMLFSRLLHMDLRKQPRRASEELLVPPPPPSLPGRAARAVLGPVQQRMAVLPLLLGLGIGFAIGYLL